MDPDQLKERYGDEYPTAVAIHGVRMPLSRETRFQRFYENKDRKQGAMVPRFFDGTAEITLEQLREEWPIWSDAERGDFCGAATWIPDQPDRPDIYRFLMRHASPLHVSSVASSVAYYLPQDEAFDLLVNALGQTGGDHTANITQAITLTRHPEAERVLREHLEFLWADGRLWDDDPFNNWTAYDAIWCIAHLLDLGAQAPEFEEMVRALASHRCEGSRRACSSHLQRHYAWLPAPEWPRFDT